MKRSLLKIALLAVCGLAATGRAGAAPPLSFLIPFKHVEADPKKPYTLRKEHGPWVIMAASFAAETDDSGLAERQAHELVIELRKRWKLPAYVHKQTYNFTDSVDGLGLNRDGQRKKMRHMNAVEFQEVAVLVGDFPAVDDPDAQKVLQRLKYAHPECLKLSEGNEMTTQRFAILREVQRRVSPDSDQRRKGPMRAAFITRNPLLPEEYFSPGGLDEFVLEMNRRVQYSLLDCPGKYTVRVATFRGSTTERLDEIEQLEEPSNWLRPWRLIGAEKESPLAIAAEKANRLTLALRQQGVEAYEFHDRHESMVTIGSFDSVGTPRRDGKIEMDPAVFAIVNTYGGQKQPVPGLASVALRPYILDGIALDVSPMPVVVPRRSLAADYARANSIYR